MTLTSDFLNNMMKGRKVLHFLFGGLLVKTILILAFAAPVYAQNGDLSNRISRLENEIETLNRAVYRGEDPPQRLYNSPSAAGGGSNQAAMAELEIRLQQMETQIRELTGRLEEQNFSIEQLRQTVDILQNQATQSSSQEDAPRPGARIEGAGGIDFTAQDPDGMQTVNPSSNNSGRGNSRASEGDPTALYEEAYAEIRNNNYSTARDAFKRFLDIHPNHVLSSNAKYWLGETYYADGEFQQAARVFAEGFQQFPSSAKSPDMLLKLGLSLSNLGRNDEACIALSQLPVKFSSGPPAILSRGRMEMEELDCDT